MFYVEGMKSAYELAMERLEASDPDSKIELNDDQRREISELEKKFKAKIAEKEVFLNKPLQLAREQGNKEEEILLVKQLSAEKDRLNEELEIAKERVRKKQS